MHVTIYHNPQCTKSRGTLALLRERGIEPEIVEYLDQPLEAATLRRVAELLGMAPMGMVRRHEAEFTEAGLDRDDVDDAAVVAAIVRYPRLLERPIVVVDDKRAAIGRPPENVLEIL